MVEATPCAESSDLILSVHTLDDYQSDELHYHEGDDEASSVIEEGIC